MRTLFDFTTYKEYLAYLAGPKGARTGFKSGLAAAAGCNVTYVSQVLHGPRDFSLEQAEQASAYLAHGEEEAHYFLLLVQKERAGTTSLRRYFETQLKDLKNRRLNLKERIGAGSHLTKENQHTYYSSWLYAAVHVALSVPELQTPAALSRYFNQKPALIKEVLQFLTGAGLAVEKGARFHIGPTLIHLGNDSKNILRHHANWRSRALFSLEREEPRDLHYSAAVTLSREDAMRLKDRLINVIKETVSEIGASKEEEVFCFAVDFFGLKEAL